MTRLLVSDLDGTLLDKTGQVHGQDAAAIRRLREDGVHVALCTGRLFSGTRHVAEELELEGPVACVDGSHIVDARSGRALHLAPVGSNDLERALGELARGRLTSFVFARDAVYYDAPGAPLLSYVSTWSRDCHELDQVTRLDHWTNHDSVVALVAIGPAGRVRETGLRIERMKSLHASAFEIRRPGYEGQWGLVVRSRAASKGTAVRWLAEHYGVAQSDVIVVGDWLNDVPMFEWAGHAFAMAQAPDEVKKAARYVLAAHTEAGGGIAEAARRMGWLE
jgi:Cof subfamily protein (haloacid dehalogenase superfamily)